MKNGLNLGFGPRDDMNIILPKNYPHGGNFWVSIFFLQIIFFRGVT